MARPRLYGASFAARLIDHAARVLAEEGPSALTVRRLAGDLNASTGAIYRTIGTKDELLRAIFLEGFSRLENEMLAVPHSLPAAERLRELGFAYQRAALSSPHLYSVMFERHVPGFEPSEADRESARASLAIIISTVEGAIASGEMRDNLGTPTDIAVRMWAVNHGVTSLVISGMLLDSDASTHLSATLDLTLSALLVRP